MSEKSDLLLVMKVWGILTLGSAFFAALALIQAIRGAGPESIALQGHTVFDLGNPGWYVEKIMLVLVYGFVGVGLYMKRNWGRLAYLYTLPFMLVYGYALLEANGTNKLFMLIGLPFSIALVFYFMNKKVRACLTD